MPRQLRTGRLETIPQRRKVYMTKGNAIYLESQQRRESNARTYPRKLPIAIIEARGVQVKDADGRMYYDCLAGAGTLALGHNHPVVVEAMKDVLNSGMPLLTLDLTTPVKERFVDELFEALPSEFAGKARIQFCGPSGADAVEAAVKLVKTATGRSVMMSFHGGYHGMTGGALSLTGNLQPKRQVGTLMPGAHFLPYPYDYRCPFGIGGEEGHQVGSRYIEHLLDDPESGVLPPAGMIMELVQGEGGVIPAPDAWAREIRRITGEREIPLIIDEVQTGIGRTGRMFAFEHAGIQPDVIVISKAVGGSLPLSVIVYREELDRWEPGAHAGTFRGNQLAMAAGTASLRFIREERLVEHAARVGQRLVKHLEQTRSAVNCIGQVRGRGLMIGAEIIDHERASDRLGSYPAYSELAREIQRQCLKRGLILELGGRHGSVVRFLPPLIVTEEEIDRIAEIFHEAVLAAERHNRIPQGVFR
ncbi:diaminobutyrate--2-oxoglutarate transaminase [Paenibacillus validus]|uniref:Diaminobutyrate--2-oxoglutarate transaminase n=1 Tax=Paenibacillus validus TaxID=44253 RepID=A0A7X3CV07_9BACL|nr:diaminobutyrate--2-oxoglutarate transaminase [Paenibacillus validus]MUG72702.1 diaminobutyrate--2-oxoglutarate transaminase family protein [Paenibacillus validus]